MRNISAIFAESIAKKYKVQAADKWKEEKPKECDLCRQLPTPKGVGLE